MVRFEPKVDEDDIQRLAASAKAFGDPTRLRIVKMLADSRYPLCVNAIAHQLDVTQSAVSQHLRVLRQAGAVTGRREGRRVHYAVNPRALREHVRLFRQALHLKKG